MADPFDGARPAKSGRQQIADGDLLHSALAVGGADRGAPQEAGNRVAVTTVIAVVVPMTAIIIAIIVVVVPMTAIVSIIVAIIARLRRRDRREARDGRPQPDDSPDAVR
jgi:Flp pilus assembly protein TadB